AMTPLESTAPRPTTPEITDVHLYDALGSVDRLWVRGRLMIASDPMPSPQRGWWNRWGKTPPPVSLASSIQILTQTSGVELKADVPLRADGYFDVSYETELPPVRRGWRMARHQITIAEKELRACNIVLPLPGKPGIGLLVVLPLEFTYDAESVQR